MFRLHSRRKAFTDAEDETLRNLVAIHGEGNWNIIAKTMPGRNPRQVIDRWTTYLSPTINRDPWTLEDDDKLLTEHAALGKRWTLIAKSFPGRTDAQVKNRLQMLQRRQKRQAVALMLSQAPSMCRATSSGFTSPVSATGETGTEPAIFTSEETQDSATAVPALEAELWYDNEYEESSTEGNFV